MAKTVGDVAVRVGADINDLKTGMQRASASVKDFSKKAGRELRDFTTQVTKMGAAAAAAAATGIVVLTARTAEAAKELRVFSQVSKSSVEEFQKLAFGAKDFNIESEKLSDILKDVNDRIGDFLSTGGGPMADFFENIAPRVGVTAQQFKNLSGPQALQLYVSTLERANLSQEEMTFYMEAMASDLTNLIPLFSQNGKLLKESGDRAERLGLILSDIDVTQLEMMSQSMKELKTIANAAGQQIAVELTPYVRALTDEIIDFIEESGGFGNTI